MPRRRVVGFILLVGTLSAFAGAAIFKGRISQLLEPSDLEFLHRVPYLNGLGLAGGILLAVGIALLLPAAAEQWLLDGPLSLSMPNRPASHPHTVLLAASLVVLLLEMALIRWISVEIRLLEYLKNYVLLACFWGMGLGCLLCAQPIRWGPFFLLPLLLIALLVPLQPYSELHLYFSTAESFHLWAMSAYVPFWGWIVGLILLVAIWLLIAIPFVPLGQCIGRSIAAGDRLRAYAVNLVGSLAGLWIMTALAIAWAPPIVWFAVILAGTVVLMPRTRAGVAVQLLSGCVILLLFSLAPSACWGPYQKVSVTPHEIHMTTGKTYTIETLTVNNGKYQPMVDLSADNLRRLNVDPADAALNHYNLPGIFCPSAGSVLVVGSGSGNDVAGALRAGAQRVVAVEIDPAIMEIGRRHHPERPYDSPRVVKVIDDARSYFEKTQDRFDLIIFGLLDSHTLASTMNNLRLDHFVYTLESFQAARRLLQPEGIMLVTFASGRPFIADRLLREVETAFGAPSLVFVDAMALPVGEGPWGGDPVIVAGDRGRIERAIREQPKLASYLKEHTLQPPRTAIMATDNWPYLYLESPGIPLLFLLASVIILPIAACIQHRVVSLRRVNSEFFLLGAGFLLLEFQGITQLARLYGSTWFVNIVVITGVLTCAVFGTAMSRKIDRCPRTVLYGALLISLIMPYATGSLLSGIPDFSVRATLLTLVQFLPFFFAGLIFPRALLITDNVSVALGSNLIGAVLGGLLECLSLDVGIRAMSLVALGLYGMAFLAGRRRQSVVPTPT